MDLNVAIESDTSITYCLENHFSTTMLSGENAKDCNKCGRLRDAKKRTMMKKAPQILVLHLKRFERTNWGSSQKLDYRVAYPFELKLSNTTEAADTEYSLSAVVVHLGNTLHSGHYVCMARSHNNWFYFDDKEVEMIDESFVQLCFGAEMNYTSASENGYLLFYERTAP
ncbi:Ubiquitin carboxyl-terminal hydrolase 3-like protein [Drosera capensis]